MGDTLRFDRERMIEVLVYHQRASIQRCACGWGELGRSHAAHVVEIYEMSVAALGANQ